MQFLKEQPVVHENREERLQLWRDSYQAYQMRLATFYNRREQFNEQIKWQQEYYRELSYQQEDLARYKREIIQKQILYSKRPVYC